MINYRMNNNDNSGTWSGALVNAFFAGAGAASANLLANVAWRDSYGRLDWRDLAFLTSVGATLCVRRVDFNKTTGMRYDHRKHIVHDNLPNIFQCVHQHTCKYQGSHLLEFVHKILWSTPELYKLDR